MAAPLAIELPPVGLDRITVNTSTGSTVASPATLTVIVLVTSPAAKLSDPVGRTPPAKSAAFAGLLPEPVTAQLTFTAEVRLSERVTV